MNMLRQFFKRASVFTLAFVFGVAAYMLWVYQLPEDDLGTDRFSWSKIEEDAALWWHRPHAFIVSVPPEPRTYEGWSCVKPNPLTLVVSVDAERRIELNEQGIGVLGNTEKLRAELSYLFRQRLENRAYREGILEDPRFSILSEFERIERNVYVEAAPSLPYGEVLKLIDELKGAGADPITLKIDDISIPAIRSEALLPN